MAFLSALRLVRQLEGGKSNNPDDPGGATNCGITQQTWHNLGFHGSVYDANDSDIATAYRKLWDSLRIENPEAGVTESFFDAIPPPADAVAFQCFINLPWVRLAPGGARHPDIEIFVQRCIGVTVDGLLGPNTFRALERQDGHKLAQAILNEQKAHYEQTAKPEFIHGLLNRIKKVDNWLRTV